MRVALIDNYDSFTFNVVHALGKEGAKVDVWRNDAIGAEELMARKHEAIVISPGPCTPNEAGVSLDVIKTAAGKVPLFGVCLGHQAIGQAFGGKVIRANPMHGKLSRITHDGKGLFRGINGPVEVTRYHSLVVEAASMPADLLATARSEDGLVMALQHRAMPVYGVQFHPESIATEQGQQICRNFLTLAREFNACTRAA
ncbi:MAG TPA: aminodeoxychorismate/anthranilate synthase component II [Rhabdaerophilum sp.]|nr:aminodeoxychorismate/anthranilate synthase component II [Rhabdaerophilum sp.]